MNCDYVFQLKLAIVTSILYLLIPRTVCNAFKYPGVEPTTNISRGRKNNLSDTKIHLAKSHFHQSYDHLVLYCEVHLKHITIYWLLQEDLM